MSINELCIEEWGHIPLNQFVDVDSSEDGSHITREAVAECTVHQKIEFILKLLNLIMSEGITPGRNTVSGQVIGTSKKSAMDVVRGKVQARQNLVETFGNWWEVNLTPFDGELYFVSINTST